MSGGRQQTLLQVWRAPGGRAELRDTGSDSDDDLLLAAAAAADPCPVQGFSEAAGAIWVYPTNLPVRPYQERMAGAALLANTLVCLPTGLGKTFVAAVVMYNFYRWFPSGKVLFLAPTKPLVAQQMEACGRVMGIPSRDMAEMTGGTQALDRRELWNTKRVFFLTPQIMVNDLSRGTCPAMEIKCLVIDEAHKALGNHAYCQVVRELSKYTNQFRVLALSATPGSDTKAVQQVISNLLIAQIEMCAEDSPEIQPYSHERQVEKIVVPLGEELVEIQNTYIKVLEAFAGRLIKVGVLSRRDIPSLTKYQLILARDQYRKNPSAQHAGIHQGIIEGDFALCISLYHGYELLLQVGIRSLFTYLWGIMDGSKGLSRTKNELGRNEDFMKLYLQLQDVFSGTALAPDSGGVCESTTALGKKKEFVYSHPKLKKLEEIVVEHFKSWKQRCSAGEEKGGSSAGDTRVMIFSSFRDSVQEIAELLARLRPAVRAMTFVGHSSGRGSKGFTHREQLEVVRRFREGGYNTLVSTCVGEEGLDIGEVDLIVCLDAQRSPVRLLQRMGRTGRRRRGRVVLILAQGREERTYNQSQCNKRSINKAISGNKTLRFYQHSPRMVPEGINPKVHKMFITAEKEEPRMLSKGRRCSSLQHKSALSACVPGQKQMNSHESWSLSPEEFEIWDRLYRIKESDGIKEPVLPRVQFETLENLEETPFALQRPEGGAARELSLCEWSLWQNQPLPTSLVEHSDRCHLFIAAMQMMELMRHQQGDCSYEQELLPHLRMEDVHVPGSRRHLSTSNPPGKQRAGCSRRDLAKCKAKPFPPDPGDNGSEFFSTFKVSKAKAPRRAPGPGEEAPVVPQDPPASPSGTRLAVARHSDLGSDKDEGLEVTFDLNAFVDLCDSSDSPASPASPAAQETSPAGESSGRIHGDSGYETSPVASGLFYLPESCRDSFTLLAAPQEPPGLQQTFSQVQRLLSQSPPSGDELQGLESMMREEGTRSPSPKVLPDGRSEALQDSVCPVSPQPDPSLLPLENPKVTVPKEFCASRSPCLSKTESSSKAAAVGEEQLWSDSFDGLFDSEEFPEIPNKAPSTSHPLTKGPSQEPFVPRDTGEALEVPGEEQSLHLFEDEAGEDMGEDSPVSTEPPAGTGREAGRDLPCREQPRGREPTGTPAGHDPYDCSQELFSVTFDLGFSIEDSGDESSEESRSADHPTLNGALGSAPGAESTEHAKMSLGDGSRLETSPGWDWRELESRAMSTPLSLQSRGGTKGAPAAGPVLGSGGSRMAREPPEPLPSALLTPTSRKGVNTNTGKRIPMKIFSNTREQIPEVPPVGEVKASPWGQNFGRSAVDSPSGRTESLEGTKPRGSCGSPAAGPSSDSEEEIVFQRKNRIKKNVLKSPDGMDESDLESPAGLSRKRRRPLSLSDSSSEDSGDFQRGRSSSRARARPQPGGAKRLRGTDTAKAAGRQFLDEEAELSQLDAQGISSDESDTGEELSPSLAQFLDDEGEPTQALNDSEMRAVYLSSVRSPAPGSSCRMVQRHFNPSAIFSQIPEQDSAYAEDSFCVGDEEEEAQSGCSEEELCVNLALLPEGCSSRGRYLTRGRRSLEQAGNGPAPGHGRKPSRIIVLSDSSEEETAASPEKPRAAGQGKGQLPRAVPSAPPAQPRGRAGAGTAPRHTHRLLGLDTAEAGMLDLPQEHPGRSTAIPPAGSGCRNTALQAAAEVCSSLKTHGSSSGSVCPAVPNPSSAPAGISRVPGDHSPSLAGMSRVPGEQSPSLAGMSRVPGDHSPSLAGMSRVPEDHSPSLAGMSRVPGDHSPSLAGMSRVPGDHSPSLAGMSRVPGDHSPSLAGMSRVPGEHSPSLAGMSRVPGEQSPSLAGMSRVPEEHSPSLAGMSRVPGDHSPSLAGMSRVPGDHSPSLAGMSRVPEEHSPSLAGMSRVPEDHSPSLAGMSRVPGQHSPSLAGISRVPGEHSPSLAGMSRVPEDHSPSLAGMSRVPEDHSPSLAGMSRVPEDHSPSLAGMSRVPEEHSPSLAGMSRVPGDHSPSLAGMSRVPGEHSPSLAGMSRVPEEHSPSLAGMSRVPGDHSPSLAGMSRVPEDHSPSLAGMSRVPGEHSPSLAGMSRVPGEHSPSLAGMSRVPEEHSPSLAGMSRVPGEHSPSLAGMSRVPGEHSPSLAGMSRVPEEHSPSLAGMSRVPGEQSPSLAAMSRVPGEQSPSLAGMSRVPEDHSPSLAGMSRVPEEHSPSLAGMSRVPEEHSPSLAGMSRVPGEQSPSLAAMSRVPGEQSPSLAGMSRVPEEHSPSLAGMSRVPEDHSPSLAGMSRVPEDHSPSLAGMSRVPEEHSPSLAAMSRVPGEHSPSLCILADSREISSGPEVISSLRAVHGLRVQVCSLGTSDYIVSSRLAVDRLLQSELQSPGNRSKLSQRLQRLQGAFQRICVIVETDRARPGETSRFFQRTQYYDGVLSALVQAGIKILFSSCQQESAALLKELALLEHRKDAAIQVPTEPEGHRRDLLNFYLSIPNLSYGAALNLCHSFSSITAVANSSLPALAAGARLSRPQAEELQRFLRHHFDLQLLPQAVPAKGKS